MTVSPMCVARAAAGSPVALVAAIVATLPAAWPAAAQGITLRVAPELATLQWGDETALERPTFIGGGLSLGFGRYVTLRGSWRRAGTLETSFADAGYRPFGSSLLENRVTTSLLSSTVLFRLGGGNVAPVVTATGGVLRLDPEGRDPTRQILVGYGGGLDMRLTPWLDGQVVVEDVRFRLDRSLLTRPDAIPATDSERGVTRGALGVTASFGLRAGGGRSSGRADDVDAGFGRLLAGDVEGLLLPVEFHVGTLRFDDALGLPDQTTVGLRAGVDFGPYFGVRGQYWRGVTDDFDAFQGVSGWTGEAQFNLGRVTGPSPFLLLGYGQTRFTDDFRQEVGAAVDNQNALVLGAGAGIPIGDRARLTVTLRDFITTAGSLDDASSTGDLRHSLGLSAGISVLALGRRAPDAPLRRSGSDGWTGPTPGDSADYRSGQVIAIPVPREGEIYLRYGPARTLPDSAAAPPPGKDTVSGAVAPAVAAALAPGATADATVEDLRRQVEELTRLMRESMGLQAAGLVLRPGGATVNVLGEGGSPGAGASGEPFIRAVEGRVGRTSLDGNGGLGIAAESYFRSLQGENQLLPFVGLEASRADVDATPGGTRVRGTVTTFATDVGVTLVLPGLASIWPTASAFLTVVNGSTSATGTTSEDAVSKLYGGLSAGAGFAVGASYRPDPEGRMLLTTALRRAWAGRKSRWNVQVGMRLVVGDLLGPPSVGPFSVRTGLDSSSAGVAGAGAPGGAEGTPGAAPATAGAQPGIPAAGPSDPAALLARLEALEAQLRQASEDREAALAEARAQQARADSLDALTQAAAADEARRRASMEEARGAVLAELRGLAAAATYVTSVVEDDDGIRVVLGGDLFPVGATEVGASARQEIGRMAAILARVDGVAMTVDGHTDGTGSAEANLTISRLRAEAVGRALVARGIPARAITALGRGQDSPVADNATREGRARNRRVEVLVRLPGEP
jgi:outer membrane protein OmpA-like peptidoglycan-associated protein